MALRSLVSLALLASATSVHAFNYTVVVGKDQVTGLPGVGFDPSRTVTNQVGDLVVFHMVQGQHQIVETSYAAPCSPIGTFDSGLRRVANGTVGVTEGPAFTFPITNSSAIHYFADIAPTADGSGTQCQQGAVFCVNTNESNNSTGSCHAFAAAALALGANAGVTTSSRPAYSTSTSSSATSSSATSTRSSTGTVSSAAASGSSSPASGAGKVVVGGGAFAALLAGAMALL